MSGRQAFETWAALPPLQLGLLAALSEDATTAFVLNPQRPEQPAQAARTVVDLHAAHIGAQLVLMFEGGDAERPIVMGVLRGGPERPDAVCVEADGERMIISAQQQLVLRCGKASITLTRAGKVLIEGSYVASRSTGVNRIKGGSVQLN